MLVRPNKLESIMNPRFGVVVLLAVACSSEEEKSGPSAQELAGKLVEGTQKLERSKTDVDVCGKQLAAAKAQPTGDGAQIVRIVGDTLTVMAAPSATGGGANVAGEAAAEQGGGDIKLRPEQQLKLYETFVSQVRGSKGAIQQCYVSALKKNRDIQARAIELKVTVTVNPSGKISNASFSPTISSDFNTCFKATATQWKVPSYTGAAISVESTVTLQPAS